MEDRLRRLSGRAVCGDGLRECPTPRCYHRLHHDLDACYCGVRAASRAGGRVRKGARSSCWAFKTRGLAGVPRGMDEAVMQMQVFCMNDCGMQWDIACAADLG